MNADIRRPEALAIGRPRLMLTDDAAAATVPVDKRRHLEPARSELRTEPQLLKEASRVGRQRHRSADLAQLGGLLVDVDLEAVLAQRDRKGQPTNATTNDCDATPIRCDHVGADGRRRGRTNAT